jgi:hypothetical protein
MPVNIATQAEACPSNNVRPCLKTKGKRTGGVAQVEECLSSGIRN